MCTWMCISPWNNSLGKKKHSRHELDWTHPTLKLPLSLLILKPRWPSPSQPPCRRCQGPPPPLPQHRCREFRPILPRHHCRPFLAPTAGPALYFALVVQPEEELDILWRAGIVQARHAIGRPGDTELGAEGGHPHRRSRSAAWRGILISSGWFVAEGCTAWHAGRDIKGIALFDIGWSTNFLFNL